MAISAKQVKDLRDITGAGFMDCKNALADTDGDLDKAVQLLREKGIAKAAKRVGRQASEGLIHSYIHGAGKLGVLVEVNCETDFVAKTDEFKEFVNNVALQICSSDPISISTDDVPGEVVASELEIFKAQAAKTGKPENICEKIAQGKMKKFYSESCLLEQPYVKDPDKTIEEYLKEVIGKLGENIVITRFSRFVLGETTTATQESSEE
ncbi:translation elongation factor Ts [Candidatus Hydrogenedentota bacterium]